MTNYQSFIKRLLSLAMALVLVFSFSACSEIQPIENTPTAEAVTEPAETRPAATFLAWAVPNYSGKPWVYMNNNVPYFTDDEITLNSFESYSDLDELGRVGVAFACLSPETQPVEGENRGSISGVSPTGWRDENGKSQNVKYDCIEGEFLYNRCHCIMWALSAENANEKNLFTGTKYLNIDGMLPWETLVDDYIDKTGNHVMYRVTPVYTENNLVADGVLMEAFSVEDNGTGVQFCIYAYNVQPGIEIDYATGASRYCGVFFDLSSSTVAYNPNARNDDEVKETYVLNTNSKKIHTLDCQFGLQISESNRREYTGTIDELLADGYTRCASCLK